MNLTGAINGETNFDCYKATVDRFERSCGKLTENSMKHMKYIREMCQGEVDMFKSFDAIKQVCY